MAEFNVGGQAVIEGVMMRSIDRVSTAVRTPSGEILIKSQEFNSITQKNKLLNTPILRGAIAFFEMLIIGIQTLNFSAEIAVREAEKEEAVNKGEAFEDKKKDRSGLMIGFTAVIAMAFGILIFFFLPLAISTLFNVDKDALSFNLIAGAVRVTMFVLYVWGISFFKDFQRVFEYHGAEHKAIFTYEMKSELTPENAKTFSRFHPRCGTSFILIVALFAIVVYAFSDTIYAILTGHPPSLLTRFAVHFCLLPLVAGGSYELLKLSAKKRYNPIVNALIQPGLWLQRITTKEPNLEQLEVAIVALESALGITTSRIAAKKTPVY
jgi:uncharacterized protein YqhQ